MKVETEIVIKLVIILGSKITLGQTLWKCSQATGVGYGSTAVDWGSFCRDLFTEYYMRNVCDVKLSTRSRSMSCCSADAPSTTAVIHAA